MKKFTKILAVCSALLVCISSLSACRNKPIEEDKSTTTSTTTTSTTTELISELSTEPTTESTTFTTTTTTTTVAPTTTTTTKQKPSTTTTTTKSKSKPTTTTTTKPKPKPTTTTTTTKNPSNYSKAEIINTYNNAVNKAISSKAGYTKSRTTNLQALEGADAILKIKVAKDAIYGFLGVGTKTYTNNKGTSTYMSSSNLKVADVQNASITKVNGDVYKITLKLTDGTSTAPTLSDNSPLRYCGLLVGKGDRGEYDYKNASNLYDGINGADGASVKNVSEKTSNTTITATLNVKTGQISNITINWHWEAKLDNVKYTIVKISGTGKADSSVTFKDFKW